MSCGRVDIDIRPAGGSAVAWTGHGHSAACLASTGASSVRISDASSVSVHAKQWGVSSIMMVCRVGKQRFLRVAPEEAMWITVDKSIDYEIHSNTDWTIE